MFHEEMDDDFGWNDGVPDFHPPRFGSDFRNSRYSNAYGDYRGGYGPPGVSGPPRPPFGFAPPPPPPPRPLFMMGRGFGPGGPPLKRLAHEDKALKYLMRCGVAKENLKNLPSELLKHIEPHFCGLCGQSFDSFPMSRIHYISKNHLKIQKRWLSKKGELGPSNTSKEPPLRAREMYCELCDVQITSKIHAETHYSGKPHRSVVDGRRLPKNPILLQPEKSGRLEQLIRREKKFLKNTGEPKNQPEETDKEKISISPELYCDICKTSVTCSEQMTMHLNGKRHLNREKQHILLMMRGGNEGNEETVTVKEEKVDEADTAAAHEDNKEGDNFDWGNGSGSWEETTAQENSGA